MFEMVEQWSYLGLVSSGTQLEWRHGLKMVGKCKFPSVHPLILIPLIFVEPHRDECRTSPCHQTSHLATAIRPPFTHRHQREEKHTKTEKKGPKWVGKKK